MFELYMRKSEEACNKAINYWKEGNFDSASFFKKVSIGFKEKAMNLSVDEV